MDVAPDPDMPNDETGWAAALTPEPEIPVEVTPDPEIPVDTAPEPEMPNEETG